MTRLAAAICVLAVLGACGEDPEELAFARCKVEVLKTLAVPTAVAFREPAKVSLRDDDTYGWHMDVAVDEKIGSGATRRSEFRCLFLVEGRDAPLFLAVLER